MSDFFKVLIPASFLILLVYLLFKSYLSKQNEQKKLEINNHSNETVLPLRLQAYERMILFLERITPNHILLRLYERAENVNDFQVILLKEIREEHYHNLAQQIYISTEVWDEIKNAMNEMIVLINQSAAELKPEDAAIKLSKKIFDRVVNEGVDPTGKAINMLKEEVQNLYH